MYAEDDQAAIRQGLEFAHTEWPESDGWTHYGCKAIWIEKADLAAILEKLSAEDSDSGPEGGWIM